MYGTLAALGQLELNQHSSFWLALAVKPGSLQHQFAVLWLLCADWAQWGLWLGSVVLRALQLGLELSGSSVGQDIQNGFCSFFFFSKTGLIEPRLIVNTFGNPR